MNIAHLLRRAGLVFGDRQAVWHGDQPCFDYRTLAARAVALACHLRDAFGVRPGDRVLIFGSNVPEYLEALQAVYWIGAVTVPVNAKLHARELAHVEEDAQPSMVMATPEFIDTIMAAGIRADRILVLGSTDYVAAVQARSSDEPLEPVLRQPDDLASLFYTSGTTGRPKGVMQTHRNLLAMTACYFTDVDSVSADDSMVYAAPMSHGAGLYHFAYVLRGARHVFPRSGCFEEAELIELAQRVGKLSLFAAPTMVRRIVQHVHRHRPDVSGINTIVYGGGPMYLEDLKEALAALGPRLVQIYGQGESPMTITTLSREVLTDRAHPRWEQRAASVGVAHSLVEVVVLGADNKPLPVGEPGEVAVRGETVMAGYWRNADATAQTLRNGWLHTGDVGVLDEDGFLTLKDRSKDLIISGGSNIYPREVEEVLLMHPAIAETSVVAQRDAEWGEVPVAFVVLHPGSSAEATQLDAWCLDHLARFKRPRRYLMVQNLPKNSYGKVLKTALVQRLVSI